MFKAGTSCDVEVLKNGPKKPLQASQIEPFIRSYHSLAVALEQNLGAFPYNFYPHHFYVGPARTREFDNLNKSTIRAYIYRRESVCLGLANGRPERRLISAGEHRIDIQ
jgi:hypothetical protein